MRNTFFGGADKVGASRTLIEIEEARILADAGSQMGVKQDEQLPDLDKIGKIDVFLLTHAHTDHTGALPELVSRLHAGVKGYCTPATKAITQVLLQDSRKRTDREEQEGKECLFTSEEIDAAMQYLEGMEEVSWWTPEQICDGVTATWIPAGHILGAAMIYIEGDQESILITGDVSVTDQKTIPGMSMSALPYQPDVMVMESTYGDRQHKDRAEEEERFISHVKRVIEAGGKVLIPVFAIGRAQEVILILKQAIQRRKIECPIWVDGMAKDVNDIYSDFPDELLPSLQRKAKRSEDLFYSNDIKQVSSKGQRNSILAGPPCCIIAPSGMLKGGWSSHYAEHLVPHAENLIAITGYQAEGNPGYTLEKKKKWKQADGTLALVECDVKRYSLSAHADRDQLTELVEKYNHVSYFLSMVSQMRERNWLNPCTKDVGKWKWCFL